MDVYTNSYCRRKHGSVIKDFHICVGKEGKSGACQGDSGGPLVCKVGDVYKLAGATSFGRSNCSVRYPTVYTRVSYYRDWIKSTAGV